MRVSTWALVVAIVLFFASVGLSTGAIEIGSPSQTQNPEGAPVTTMTWDGPPKQFETGTALEKRA